MRFTRVAREGCDVTRIIGGTTVQRALAADNKMPHEGVSAGVIPMRTL
jgi:transketolase C-terminal domain/subunit